MTNFKIQFNSRRSNIIGRNGMVATSQPLAAQAGIDILKAGGNAIDAAIEVQCSDVHSSTHQVTHLSEGHLSGGASHLSLKGDLQPHGVRFKSSTSASPGTVTGASEADSSPHRPY